MAQENLIEEIKRLKQEQLENELLNLTMKKKATMVSKMLLFMMASQKYSRELFLDVMD